MFHVPNRLFRIQNRCSELGILPKLLKQPGTGHSELKIRCFEFDAVCVPEFFIHPARNLPSVSEENLTLISGWTCNRTGLDYGIPGTQILQLYERKERVYPV